MPKISRYLNSQGTQAQRFENVHFLTTLIGICRFSGNYSNPKTFPVKLYMQNVERAS